MLDSYLKILAQLFDIILMHFSRLMDEVQTT